MTTSAQHDTPEALERERTRYRKIFGAGGMAVISKAITLLVGAISVPLTVRYLGAAQYGIWITISTTIVMLAVMDLGIANTLTNLISEAFARDNKDLAGRYATTAFWLMVLVMLLLGLGGWLVWPYLNWDFIFHLHGTGLQAMTSKACAIAYVMFLIGLPAGLATKLLGGYQEVHTAYIFSSIGSLLSLAVTIAVIHVHGSMPMLVLGYVGAMVVANILCLVWLWTWHKPWLAPLPYRMDRSLASNIMQSGSWFFLLQLSSLVVFNSDNIVIAHYMDTASVTPYSVTWRLVGYSMVLQTLLVPSLWPAYSEAYIRGDLAWIRKTYKYVMRLTLSMTIVFCLVLIFFGQTIIGWWAGSTAVPPVSLILAMCVWGMIGTIMGNQSSLLVAANEIRMQAWVSALAAVMNLAMTIFLIRRIGTIGVILGTILSYMVCIVGPQTWKVRQVMRRKRIV